MDIFAIFTDLDSPFGTISGPMNRVFDIKSGHDFCRYGNFIQIIYFQINDSDAEIVTRSIKPEGSKIRLYC